MLAVALVAGGSLWGVLQPGMTTCPRAWTPDERAALLALSPSFAALVVAALSGGSRRVARRGSDVLQQRDRVVFAQSRRASFVEQAS